MELLHLAQNRRKSLYHGGDFTATVDGSVSWLQSACVSAER